ncbi:MAG: ATP-dependent Clp protease adapter ClpS [Halothiobacillaceae bacterium]
MTDPQIHPDREGDLALEEEPTPVAPPPMYKVIMLNDDFTPMEFVVLVLVRYFGMDNDRATAIMLEVHNRGRAVCGVFTREVAETKVMQVNDLARQNQHPLLCMMEEA